MNPDPLPPEVQKALDETHEGGAGLYLHGVPGVGKSVALHILSKRIRGEFYTDRGIIDLHRRAMESEYADEKRDLRRRIDSLRAAKVVYLDDLASGRETPYTDYEAGLLGDLVDRWYEAGTLMVIASNKPLREIGPILGPRTVSRLTSCRVVEYRGPDRRIALAGQPPPIATSVVSPDEQARREWRNRSTEDILPGETRDGYARRRAAWIKFVVSRTPEEKVEMSALFKRLGLRWDY